VRARLSVVVAVAMFGAAISHAQCVSQLREASSGIFNRLPAAVAWSGTILGVAKIDESAGRAITFATYNESLDQLTSDRSVAAASFAGPLALVT